MILINLTGGPGAGKTTLCHYLAYRLKLAGIRTEVTGEASRDHIYAYPADRVPLQLLDNQVLVVGQQFEKIKKFHRHNFEVVLCDSALEQQTMYFEGHAYAKNLKLVMADCARQFETYNVFIHRTKGVYDPESRVQRTEAEAIAFDGKVRRLFKNRFWKEVKWNEIEELGDAIVALALSKRPKKRTVCFPGAKS